jgi:hypothetical protein
MAEETMSDNRIVKHPAAGGSVTVSLNGALTIEDAAEFQKALIAALGEAPTVLLDARQLVGIDMTILQIICSACKSAAAGRLAFLPDGRLPDCVTSVVNSIGARTGSLCPHNNNEPCTWFGGAK